MQKKRLRSLDVFRGLTVALMVVVNNPGDWGNVYPPLLHAQWHGCTPTDLVFPFFLFIVGVAISLSLNKKKFDKQTHPQIIQSVLKRGILIFLLGFLTMLYPKFDFNTVRIMGVLQRIGIVYVVVSVLFITLNTKNLIFATLFIFIGYGLAVGLMPDYSKGYVDLAQKDVNFGAYLDRLIFTERHLWAAAKTWDPEGLFSTIGSLSTALMGVWVGNLLSMPKEPKRMFQITVLGLASVVLGLVLSPILPINKALWTSTYSLFTSGLAIGVLVFLHWLIDLKGYLGVFKPFMWYGVNAMLVFFGSAMLVKTLRLIQVSTPHSDKPVALTRYFYDNCFKVNFNVAQNASLAYAVFWLLFWGIILYVLHRKNWIWKV